MCLVMCHTVTGKSAQEPQRAAAEAANGTRAKVIVGGMLIQQSYYTLQKLYLYVVINLQYII